MKRNLLTSSLRVVEYVSRSPEQVGVREISRAVGMAVASTHRVLQALKRERLVVQVGERGMYRTGDRLAELASNLLRANDLVPVALPFLQQMAKRSGESVVLMVADGHEAVSVAAIEGDHLLRVVFPAGWRGPLHRGASGSVLLAFQPEETIQAVIRNGLRAPPASRLASAQQLLNKLSAIRRSGSSVSHGERAQGLSSVAAAVRGPNGAVIASVALYGPSSRISRNGVAKHLSIVRSCAEEITDALTGRWAGTVGTSTSSPARARTDARL